MFVRVQKRETKNKGITYNFYTCSEVNGKRKDKFILKINQVDFEDGKAWEDRITEKNFSYDLFKLVHDKACEIWKEKYDKIERLNYTCDDLYNIQLLYGSKIIITFNKNDCTYEEVCANISRHHMDTIVELGVTYRDIVKFVRNIIYDEDNAQGNKVKQLERELEYWKMMATINKSNSYTSFVSPSLSKDEYRVLMKLCHPDANNNSEDSIKATQILNKLYKK